jgi:hypothetical protein
MKCSSSRRVPRRHRRNAYEKHNGDFRSEAAGGSIHVRSVLLLAGCPGDTEETPTKNTTGTSGPRRPVDPCSKCSSSRRVPRRHRRNAYEKHNGDFRSEAAGGSIHVRSVLLLAGCPGDTEETPTKNTTGTFGPKRPVDPCSKCFSLAGSPGDTEDACEKRNGDFRSEAAGGSMTLNPKP